jgi:hypothetical protein
MVELGGDCVAVLLVPCVDGRGDIREGGKLGGWIERAPWVVGNDLKPAGQQAAQRGKFGRHQPSDARCAAAVNCGAEDIL